MSRIDTEKLEAFRKRYSDVVGEGIREGLLSSGTISLPGIGLSAGGGNYDQDGGSYTQNTGGTHTQSGGGGYTQSPPPKVV